MEGGPEREDDRASEPERTGGRIHGLGRRLHAWLDLRIGLDAALRWGRSIRFPEGVNFTTRFGTVALFLLIFIFLYSLFKK